MNRPSPSARSPGAPAPEKSSPARRSGRRAGGSGTREQILEAARSNFSARGFGATTIRGVAAEAGVDAALVHYFFGTKEGLFAATLELPFNPIELIAAALEGPRDGLGERLVRAALEIWAGERARGALLALVRSAGSHDTAAAMLRGVVEHAIVGRLAAAVGEQPDARLRGTLAGSQIAGLIVARYVVGVEPLASAEPETIVAAVGPTVQRYLTGDIGAAARPTPP